MARIRTIKPEYWQDEKLSPCDPLTRLVFLGLVSLADDAGRLVDNLRLIDAQIFPNTADTAHEALMRLSGMGRIRRGVTASGQRIIEIVHWARHQKIQHPNLRGALPEIVEEQALPVPHEPLMKHSGAAHEPLTHHTNDQRPTTNDQRPKVRRAEGAPPTGKKMPHFSDEARAAVLSQFRKIGEVPAGRVLTAVGPYFRAADDPRHVPHEVVLQAIADYCGLVTKGRSAPFAGPEDCAKRLGALIRNVQEQSRHDPLARVDAQLVAIHGHVPRVA